MTIELSKDTQKLLKELQGNKGILEIAAGFDFGIDTETYAAIGLVYMHTDDSRLKDRIINYLCEINFHSSHEALENNDFYTYYKAY